MCLLGRLTKLNVTIKLVRSRAAVVEYDAMYFEDERSLLGYTLYSMPAPYQNVTLFDGRDACGNDGWKPDDLTDFGFTGKNSALLTHLSPYTQYAFYIKTYTIAKEPNGGQSDIHYFRTKADQPESVRNLNITANGSNEIVSSLFMRDIKLTFFSFFIRMCNGSHQEGRMVI